MRSHFHECVFFNRAEFSLELLEWDLTFFLDLGNQKRQVGKNLKMGKLRFIKNERLFVCLTIESL